MGLYPRKGALAVGSDADIVLLDRRSAKTIKAADLHETDYTPWEGHDVAAWPTRDDPARQGRRRERRASTATSSDGQFLPRKVADEIRSRPAV